MSDRRPPECMEQAELWPSRPQFESAPAAEQAIVEADPVWVSQMPAQDDCMEAEENMAVTPQAPSARPATLSRRFVTRAITQQAAAPVKPGRRIARFLNVNNAIKAFDHGEEFNRYQQPESGLSRMFRFLRGSAPASQYTSLFF